MKNGTKTVICAAFLLVAMGGLMTAAPAAMGNLDMERRKGLSYEMKTFEVKEAFSDIRVEDAECNVRILRAADGKCKVVCPEKQDGSIYHTVTVSDGGAIRIETTSGSVKGTLLSDKIFITDSTSGSVKVPRSFVGGECEITTTSGSISIEIKQ